MLERAAACLKSGAARDSLRCGIKAQKSKRMLHSTFWNHGAGALDLPPCAVSMLPMPSDLPMRHDSDDSSGTRRQREAKAPVASEGVFLDFLYPPQALAWLQRASVQQQAQKWEKRNMRRLPEGFVVASRSYASKSYQRSMNARDAVEAEVQEDGESGDVYQPFGSLSQETIEHPVSREKIADGGEGRDWAYDRTNRNDELTGEDTDGSFAISPGDLAESTPNLLISLRNLLMFNRGANIVEKSEASQKLTERAWKMFQSLDNETREDPKLKRELLEWFALHDDEVPASHCEELYQSIPTGQRTLEIYNAMMSMYLRQEKISSASYLHHESLQTLENGHMISKRLFQHAIERQMWDLAIETATQHHNRYTELNQTNQIQLFWLHVSEMPRLVEYAMQLFRYLGRRAGVQAADLKSRSFAQRFFKEALGQLSITARDQKDRQWFKAFRQQRHREDFISMLQFVTETDGAPAKILEDTLLAFLNRKLSEYRHYHEIVSSMYRGYRKLTDVTPSPQLLGLITWHLSYYEPGRDINEASAKNVTTDDIMNDWKSLYGKPSKTAYVRLIETFAYAGRVDEHENWMRDFRTLYPEYQDWKDSLWTLIYLYAQRSNLDSAQQAFATVKRTMGEYGDEPDQKCWGVLLHAHGRADDLEGAFTNFQSMMEKLKPTETCFAPIFHMLARRGDVEGIQDFMEQFDEIVGTRRSTLTVTHLINAHVHQGSVPEAESVLRDAISKVKAGEIIGYLTPCFNAMLKAHARRHDIDAAMRTYHWMKHEKAQMDSDSFAAIMMALVNFRRHQDALRILRVDMPEHHIEPKAFHFAVIMQRLVANTDYKYAIKIHEEMISQNIRPSVATNTLYIKAKAHIESNERSNLSDGDDQQVPLETSVKALEEVLDQYDGEEVAVRQLHFLVGRDDNTSADPGPYFEALISIHGKRGCFEAVKSLFAKYKEAAQGRGGDESKLPLNLTTSLMSAHWHAGEYEQVEEYWKLAKERADELARPVPVPSFKYLVTEESLESTDPFTLHPSSNPSPGPKLDGSQHSTTSSSQGTQTLLTDKTATMKIRPAARRRHMLSSPLRWYLAALSSQARVVDAIQTVSRLLMQGYTIDNPTWNAFICFLLDTTPPLALVAFTLTERFLTPGFPGWQRRSRLRMRVRRRARYEGLEYINARYVEPGRLMPQYKTLVRLGAALLDIRRLESQGRRGINTNVPPDLQKFIGTTRDIRKLAAKTLHVVQSIPYIIGDRSQAKYLRRNME